jgi:hypothetical protein
MSTLPTIKDKIILILFLIRENISNSKLYSLQNLVNAIGNNPYLEIFSHSSLDSFLEFLKIMYKTYKKLIQKSINLFKYYGLIVDESIKVNGINQLAVYIGVKIKPKIKTKKAPMTLLSVTMTICWRYF